jgi:hypothetical protein
MDARNKQYASSCSQLITFAISTLCEQFCLHANLRGTFWDPRFRAFVTIWCKCASCFWVIVHHHHQQQQNRHISAIVFLRNICQTFIFLRELRDPVSTSLDFTTVFFYRAGLSNLRPTPQFGKLGSPTDRVSQLYAQAPGSLFVDFYDSQDYGGSILTRLHAPP